MIPVGAMNANGDSPHYRLVAIDDREDLLALYRMMFRGTVVEFVGEAGDGREGVAVVKRLKPDVVLLDLSMPEMDGLEALIEIRRAVPDARVVILSGFGADRMADVAEELGASVYIEKGASPGTILRVLEEAARSAPRPMPNVTPDFHERLERLL